MTFLYKSELGGKVIQLSTVALERSLIGILNKKSGKTTASKRVLKCIPADMRWSEEVLLAAKAGEEGSKLELKGVGEEGIEFL